MKNKGGTEVVELANLKLAHKTLVEKYIKTELDQALDALDRTMHPKAKEWRAWRNKRLSPPILPPANP